IFSISVVRIAFCAFTIFGLYDTREPSKYFFKVATPLLIHNNVGSSFGTSETLGSMVCPFSLKNCKNNALVSAEVLCFIHRSSIDYLTNKKPITALHCRDELSRYHPNYEYYDSSLISNNGHDRWWLTTLQCSFHNECWWDSLQRFKSLSVF